MVIISCILALAVGAVAGYRIVGNTALRNYYDNLVLEHKQNTDLEIPREQLIKKLETYAGTGEFVRLVYVGAVVYSFPPFLIILPVMILRARRQDKRSVPSSTDRPSPKGEKK